MVWMLYPGLFARDAPGALARLVLVAPAQRRDLVGQHSGMAVGIRQEWIGKLPLG